MLVNIQNNIQEPRLLCDRVGWNEVHEALAGESQLFGRLDLEARLDVEDKQAIALPALVDFG